MIKKVLIKIAIALLLSLILYWPVGINLTACIIFFAAVSAVALADMLDSETPKATLIVFSIILFLLCAGVFFTKEPLLIALFGPICLGTWAMNHFHDKRNQNKDV